MPNEWSFRHEILLATKRWPWLVLFCLAGSLLGWFVSMIWPTPHRATRELYVGLNVYRSIDDLSVFEYAGVKLVNANDYKNWQMSSLNNLIFMDTVIDDTLARLQKQDPYWKSVERDDFAQSLHVYWRNAGKWRLVAEHQDPELAAAAVTAWQQVVLDYVQYAVIESQEAMLLEFRLRALADQKTSTALIADEIQQVKTAYESWQEELGELPDQAIIQPDDHWQRWQQATRIRSSVDWGDLLDAFPSEGSTRQEYLSWLNRVIPLLDNELDSLHQVLQNIEVEENSTAAQFSQASRNSLGLSASLDVDKISETRTLQIVTRPTGLLMLTGSLFGLFSWLAHWISRTSLGSKV